MEEAWENFWSSGKVTDYLSYRLAVNDRMNKEEQKNYVTNSCIDGNGSNLNAH